MKKALLLLPFLLAAKFSFADVMTADDTLTKQVGADSASQITFEAGRATLTDSEITALNDLVNEARANNEKIDSIKVFVWGDQVYSETAGQAATAAERKVADNRIANIKKYLQKDLKVRKVETYNMTKQPEAFSNLINASGSTINSMKTKSPSAAAETPAPTTQELTQFAKGNPSEALVLVYKK